MKKCIRSATYLRTINIIYLAQVATLIGFSLVAFYLNHSEQRISDRAIASMLQYPLTISFVIGLAASQLVPRYLIRKIDKGQPLKIKMPKYATAAVIRPACLESPGIFACIVAYLSGQSYYLLVIPMLLVIFLLYRPSRTAIADELNLSDEERKQLSDPDAIIAEVEGEER